MQLQLKAASSTLTPLTEDNTNCNQQFYFLSHTESIFLFHCTQQQSRVALMLYETFFLFSLLAKHPYRLNLYVPPRFVAMESSSAALSFKHIE
jgi:hypothetical protein